MTDDEVTDEDKFAGLELQAHRVKAGLTQIQVQKITGIDRSKLSNLENGRVPITMTYAERLAPIYNVDDPLRLLPPLPPRKPDVRSPFDRLAKLEGQVAAERRKAAAFAQEVTARLVALEAALAQQERRSDPRSSEQEG